MVRLVLLLLALSVTARAAPIPVVAAENFYGDIARQVGGGDVAVTSILSNPEQDPHSFEASPSVARALSGARVVVLNGAGYDPWMDKLLGASRSPARVVVNAAELTGHKPGDNPHIWYDPATARVMAAALAQAFGQADPAHAAAFAERRAAFERSLEAVDARIAALRGRLAGTAATATEPVFGYVLAALGMENRNERFQLAVMNGTEPAASDVAAFEGDLKGRRVRLLVYNSQATGPVAARMAKLARAQGIPVVGVTETEPPGRSYQAWLLGELDAIDRALPAR